MSKKKSEAFEAETQILVKARETLEKSSDDADALRQAYASICDEYERLLEEARFLTKVSDKLEVKLNKANEQLEAHNKQLSSEKELVENEMGRALKTNKKLREEKSGLDESRNKLQMVIVFSIAAVVVILAIFFWLAYELKTDLDARDTAINKLKENQDRLEQAKIQMEQERDSLAKLIPAPRDNKRRQPKPEETSAEGGLIYYF